MPYRLQTYLQGQFIYRLYAKTQKRVSYIGQLLQRFDQLCVRHSDSIMSKECYLYQYTSNDELEVYRIYGRTPESFAEDVETVREWSKKQPHFPEVPRELLMDFNFDCINFYFINVKADVLIKSFLRSSKCSVERVKQRLDMYYAIRNFTPEFFRHPLTPEVLEQTKYV